jgi:TRAP transporter TAXI family solute receptor
MQEVMMRSIVLAGLMGLAAAPAPALTFFSVGSGDIDGNYYRVASAICAIINRDMPGEMRCSPESTAGSIYNLVALRDGELDIGIVQSDWQKHAVDGDSVFARSGPMSGLVGVMSLYDETFTVLARRDAGIASFRDLAGKRVDIGHPSSGRQATMRVVMDLYQMKTEDFSALSELQTGPALAELCAGRVDATVLITGHPSASLQKTLETCDVELVSLTGAEIAGFVASHDEYNTAVIKAGTYPGLGADVPTFAVTATVVALSTADSAVVGKMVSETLENLGNLRLAAPVLRGLDPAQMRTEGFSVPLHPAAEAAFDAANVP